MTLIDHQPWALCDPHAQPWILCDHWQDGNYVATAAPPAAPLIFKQPPGVPDGGFYYPTSGAQGGTGLIVRGINRLSGMVEGGALLAATIFDVPIEAASTPTCRFGKVVVPAVLHTTALVSCMAPNVTEAGPVDLAVSLNAQDYSSGGDQFCFINVTGAVVEPSEAPLAGGTRLLIRASGLVPHGCHVDEDREPRRCRFTNPLTSESLLEPASISEERGALVCYTPPNPQGWAAGTVLELNVSLNSLDYVTAAPSFRYEKLPDLPSLSPASGPVMGGTHLRLSGSAMRDVEGLACFFGACAAAATWVNNEEVYCSTPDLHSVLSAVAVAPADSTEPVLEVYANANQITKDAAATAPILDLLFNDAVARLFAQATDLKAYWGLDSSTVTIGALTLSGGVVINQLSGHLTCTDEPGPAEGMLTVALPNCNAPLRAFDLYIEVLFREAEAQSSLTPTGGKQGGFTIEYGPEPNGHVPPCEVAAARVDDSLSEALPASGISVSLLASRAGLLPNVTHNGSELLSTGEATQLTELFGPPLDMWHGLELSVLVDPTSHLAYLNVSLSGQPIAELIDLPNWEPRAGWTFRLRAIGQAHFRTSLSTVRLLSGAMAQRSPVELLIAVGVLFVSPSTPFVYYTPPFVPAGGVWPASGPILGGTLVRVLVSNYSRTIGLLDGAAADLKCRFGAAEPVVAVHWRPAVDGPRMGMECTTPAAVGGTSTVVLRLSANGQQYTDVGSFELYQAGGWADAKPRAGPMDGGALVTVRGDHFAGGDTYACRIGGIEVPATYRAAPPSVQCLSPSTVVEGPTSHPVEVTANGQQFVALESFNGSFYVHRPAVNASAAPLSGPANGGTVVQVHMPGSGLGTSSNDVLRYRCIFGVAQRSTADEMLIDGGGVVAATHMGDDVLQCISPSAEDAGGGDYLQLLAPPLHVHTVGGAIVSDDASATLSGSGGECGSLLVPPHHISMGTDRKNWFEHSLLLHATAPEPAWGGGGHIATMGGFSWSYAVLPYPGARAVVGSAGAGLGLIVRIAGQLDGSVAWQVLIHGTMFASSTLEQAERDALVAEAWRPLLVRLDQRGFHLQLGSSVLLDGVPLPGLNPSDEWRFALGACGIAPAQPTNGVWSVANVTIRSGARLRYADEWFRISLNGQQMAPSELTFRFYAAATPTVLVPRSGPLAGSTNVTLEANHLVGASPSSFRCDFRWGTSQELTPALLLKGSSETNDGLGGAGKVRCQTPASPTLGESLVGLMLEREGQSYSTFDDGAAALPRPFVFYPALPASTIHLPLTGPAAGGTLVRINLPVLPDLSPLVARCRFGSVVSPFFSTASLAEEGAMAVCATPPMPPGDAPLHLALNGLDFEPLGVPLSFAVFSPPVLHKVVPAGATPGVAVTLVGAHLAGGVPGVNHSCSFGGQVVPATLQPEPRVVDNEWSADTVCCVVPPSLADGHSRSTFLRLSLNGQQYTAEEVPFSVAVMGAGEYMKAMRTDSGVETGSGSRDLSAQGELQVSSGELEAGSG